LGLGLGLFTRLAGPCAALYYLNYLIATVAGGHFGNGFIWVSPDGGWEYSVLMMVLLLSYTYAGSGPFSLDGALIRAGRMPRTLLGPSSRANDRPAR
jgi:putative oxidoreductase